MEKWMEDLDEENIFNKPIYLWNWNIKMFIRGNLFIPSKNAQIPPFSRPKR